MIGKTISHYKILEKLGEGGMGVVYKAEDTKLERPVALKFLSPSSLGTEEERIRFIREAKAAAALAHPNICTIHEIDDVDDKVFISMEHLKGRTLDKKIESGPIDIGEGVNIALRVAEGLKHAHKRGIVHRDIKPANIIVTEDGQIKIMDFGLAKLSGKTRLTKTATVMGTIAYMSPEQARGDKDIGHQTDIWSLGIVLYEMLTGKLPFDAETDTGLIYKIINENPESIRNHRSDIPPPLASIVEKSIQKDSQRRHKDAEDLITDLEGVRLTSTTIADLSTPSIAVLPFLNMSADPEQEYFCDGLAEEMINALAQIEGLHVVARTSAFSFKGQNLDVREIGKRLSVETVLEGSVRKAGNRLRITGQLVKVSDGYHLWSEKFDREMEDIFAIQDEISDAIVEKLRPRLIRTRRKPRSARQTIDIGAYNLYLEGLYFWNKMTEDGLSRAIELFKRTIEKAPDYALAYTGLANSYFYHSWHGFSTQKDSIPKMREAILEALELDDTLSEAHASFGLMKMYYMDWDDAEQEFLKAIELNPGSQAAHHWYGHLLMFLGKFEKGIEELKRAREIDPLSVMINGCVGTNLREVGRNKEAIEALERTIALDPNFPGAHGSLGLAYLAEGMREEAMAEFAKEQAVAARGEIVAEGYIGYAYAMMGETDKARQVLEKIMNQVEEGHVPESWIAGILFDIGEKEKGFEWLDKARKNGDMHLPFIRINPAFESVRADPRYRAVLKKLDLEP